MAILCVPFILGSEICLEYIYPITLCLMMICSDGKDKGFLTGDLGVSTDPIFTNYGLLINYLNIRFFIYKMEVIMHMLKGLLLKDERKKYLRSILKTSFAHVF